ncbi:MAG: hypothetical protein ACP5LQ_02090 [Candidatus Methanodesulfokora sp.]
MKKLILLLLLALLLSPVQVRAQPRFWTALNFELEFRGDGTALVEVKQHPFDYAGRSLIGNTTLINMIKEDESDMIRYVLLMFSNRPDSVSYKVMMHSTLLNNETVVCDPLNTGRLSEYRGSLSMRILVYLNSADFVRKIDDSYEITVVDSFTERDPRSWIDYIGFNFSKGAELISYRWEPSFAKGPTNVSRNYLSWYNYNERDAPDRYIFEVKMTIKREVKWLLSASAVLSGDCIAVTLNNKGNSSYFYISIGDQTRKVYVGSGSSKNIKICNVSLGPVKIYGENGLLLENLTPSHSFVPSTADYGLSYVFLLAGLSLITASFFIRKIEKQLQQA